MKIIILSICFSFLFKKSISNSIVKHRYLEHRFHECFDIMKHSDFQDCCCSNSKKSSFSQIYLSSSLYISKYIPNQKIICFSRFQTVFLDQFYENILTQRKHTEIKLIYLQSLWCVLKYAIFFLISLVLQMEIILIIDEYKILSQDVEKDGKRKNDFEKSVWNLNQHVFQNFFKIRTL